MVGQFFDAVIVVLSESNGYDHPSKYNCWKLFQATLIQMLLFLGETI